MQGKCFCFFLLTFMVIINEDLSCVLAKYSPHSVEVCKLISFHGLKLGEPKHLLCFYLPYYKVFTKWPAMFHARHFFQVATWSLPCVEYMMKEGHRIWVVAGEPETMPMVVQMKLTELNGWNKFTYFCPTSGWKLCNMEISHRMDMLIFIYSKV